jgi:hypothetical protein
MQLQKHNVPRSNLNPFDLKLMGEIKMSVKPCVFITTTNLNLKKIEWCLLHIDRVYGG